MSSENIFKTPVDLKLLSIKPLDPKTDRAAFCCGTTRIDNFCRNNAKKQHGRNLVRVYDAHLDGTLVGFYYLVASSNPPDMVSEEAAEKFGRVKAAPCVYLGMVGTHAEYQRNGIGRVLMLDAMTITLKVAEYVGLYALTLEAINQEKADLYRRWGFQYFIDGELKMFMPIGTIRQLLTP